MASTVVTMAEMGSVGQDILDTHGISDIDPNAWYPSQLRREIHEAVWQRFGDIALLSFGLGLLDFYPQTLAEFGKSVEQYGTMMTAAHADDQRIRNNHAHKCEEKSRGAVQFGMMMGQIGADAQFTCFVRISPKLLAGRRQSHVLKNTGRV